ncbi:MAG: LPS assembly protein LptD [Alphaproteobacteria bacterium]|nr:LPS assembly protein LptD [Alphaproteobacteria bacterium]
MVRAEPNAGRSRNAAWRRGVAIAAALVASSGAALAQPAATPAAPEADAVVLEADQILRDTSDNLIIAEGSVEARYDGRTLRADRVVYDLQKRTVHAQGGVQIIDADGSIRTAEEIEVAEDLGAGVATGFGARFPNGGALAANSAIRNADGSSKLGRLVYTACPVCAPGEKGPPPTWTLRARRAVQDPGAKMIFYRDALLSVRGVPIVYLPYFAHPDPTAGRRSGFLTPDVGSSSKLGVFYQQPYYWAISDYSDLTVSPQFHSKVNPLLAVEYRKRFWSGDLRFDVTGTQEKDFDSDGNKFGDNTFRGSIFGQGRFRLNEKWNWGFGVERISDDLYLRRYDVSGAGRQRGQFIGTDTRLITQADLVGQTASSYTSVSAVTFQGLRIADTSAFLPIVAPLAETSRTLRDPVFDGQVRLRASTVNLVRTDGVDSSRASVGGVWNRETIVGPGLVVTPRVEARSDFYRFNDSGRNDNFGRAVGSTSLTVRWPLARPGKTALLVEPIAMAALGSNGGNDPRIVNEDSQTLELDDTNIFDPTATQNYDLWEGGARASVGLRATAAVSTSGTASLVVGRRWRDKADAAFGPSTNLNGRSSDYVAAASADFKRFGGTIRARFDDESLSVVRLDAAVRAAVGPIYADARYFQVDQGLRGSDPSEQIQANISYALTKKWRASFGGLRDLNSNTNLSQRAALTYQDNCTFFEVGYRRQDTQDRRLGPNDGFEIRVGLTTLGMFGGQ